MIDLDQSFMN